MSLEEIQLAAWKRFNLNKLQYLCELIHFLKPDKEFKIGKENRRRFLADLDGLFSKALTSVIFRKSIK
jgi:hypothetical protein